MNAPQDIRQMTADSIGKDLLQALVTELRLLPKPWDQLPQNKQDDILDRLRARVDTNIKMAVHLLAAQGRTTVVADLDQITRKDGIKAVFKINSNTAGRHELFDSEGKACLIIVADATDHTAGMDDVRGEADQRAMDLGHEYHDNDGGGMDGAAGEGDVIEGEVLGLPAPGETAPTEEDLEQAHEDGYQAAADGKAKTDCPVMRGELCIAWIKGWERWHELNGDDQGEDRAAA